MRRMIFVPECLWCDHQRSKDMVTIAWSGKTHAIHHRCRTEMQSWLSFRAMR